MVESSSFGVAVVGCGTVGGEVARILASDGEILRSRCGRTLELRHVVDLDFSHARELGLDETLFRKDLGEALADYK